MQFHSLFQLVYSAHPHLISIRSNQEMNIKFSLLAWHKSNNIQYYQFIINYSPLISILEIFKLRLQFDSEEADSRTLGDLSENHFLLRSSH